MAQRDDPSRLSMPYLTLPAEFVQSLGSGAHPFEVLAIEASGSQSITEGSFVIPWTVSALHGGLERLLGHPGLSGARGMKDARINRHGAWWPSGAVWRPPAKPFCLCHGGR
jgi:hypothetical protein